MSARRQREPAHEQAKRFARSWRAIALGIAALLVVVVVAWLALQPRAGELPGPLGGPSVAQDVNTLVGKPAPPFTLSDSEGKSYTVTPGQGRPTVLIFHMGIT